MRFGVVHCAWAMGATRKADKAEMRKPPIYLATTNLFPKFIIV
jgi:hypothetical protein